MIPNSIKVPVPWDYVAPHGALCLGVEPATDFDKRGQGDDQLRDKETGERVWLVRVLDLDPEAGKFGGSKEFCRAVTNAATDWWRKAHRRQENPVDVLPDVPGADTTAAFDTRQSLVVALQRLTQRERTVVVLRYLQDFTERDVAQALDISVGTVKSTCHTALRKLRVTIGQDETDASSSHLDRTVSIRT